MDVSLGLTEYGVLLGLSRYWYYLQQKENEQKIFVNKTRITNVSSKSNIADLAFKVDTTTFMISLSYYIVFFVCYWIVLY